MAFLFNSESELLGSSEKLRHHARDRKNNCNWEQWEVVGKTKLKEELPLSLTIYIVKVFGILMFGI